MAFKNPFPTMGIIIETGHGIVLIARANSPFGWGIPGGFMDYVESLEDATRRETLEETVLKIELLFQFYIYSAPPQDSRQNNILQYLLLRPGFL